MSSTPNDSSADKSVSGDTTTCDSNVASSIDNQDKCSANVTDLLAYFTNVFQSKLPVAEQDIDPARSPELDFIKIETKELPDKTFKALSEILQVVDSQRAQLAVFRSKAVKNKPLPDDMFETQYYSMVDSGSQIFARHRQAISESVTLVKESRGTLVSRIRESHDQSEDIKHRQNQLSAVKDDIVPLMPSVMKPVQNVAKVGVGLAACDISRNLDESLKSLEISDEASRGDLQVITKTESKLKDYLRDNEHAVGDLIYICSSIYPGALDADISNDTTTIILQRIDLADHKMSEIIPPIENCLAQWKGNYGIGITVIREVNAFCDVVPQLIEDIERIFGAKEIIKSTHQAEFGETVYKLGFTIFKYLGQMKDNFNQKKIDPEQHKEFQQVSTLDLINETADLIYPLRIILNTQTSSSKSKKAEKNRKADDRCFEDGTWTNKTLVKPGEVQAILDKVKSAVKTIYRLANASATGKITESIRGDKVERAHFKLDISVEPLRRLHQVLGQDVDAGLKRLEKLLIEQEPKAQEGQIKSFLRMFNRHRR
ncbi:hypothetical protein AGABI2DRAFT_193962 [Agaricus bisporus var. bisporus H97]|uniref:hypothetical protein n=1 Tax=Agaricus bisporus var. bisporus (strain H97 / ATCC MYA-4626 / FGSC 10389) TaxID=936046 RepID=UPI00029F6438|nr:hypothetical protein AGABI2DRAFT_193962 [Agaricus bisporus var. bisporus H97]EKV46069.1 hypothetical protein AGABI2DRAFT_193962 [Agaricus bisporus var. bisporus H97]